MTKPNYCLFCNRKFKSASGLTYHRLQWCPTTMKAMKNSSQKAMTWKNSSQQGLRPQTVAGDLLHTSINGQGLDEGLDNLWEPG